MGSIVERPDSEQDIQGNWDSLDGLECYGDRDLQYDWDHQLRSAEGSRHPVEWWHPRRTREAIEIFKNDIVP